MATALIGRHFSYNIGVINFFGAAALREGSKYYHVFKGGLQVPLSFESITPEIRACIAEDIENGDGDKIAGLNLGAHQAKLLFLEGIITIENLRNVTEGVNDSGLDYVDIPNVIIDGRALKVRVLDTMEDFLATVDTDDNVLGF